MPTVNRVNAAIGRGVEVFRKGGWVAFAGKLFSKFVYAKRVWIWLEYKIGDRAPQESDLNVELVTNENYESTFAKFHQRFDSLLKPSLNLDSVLFVGSLDDPVICVTRARIRGSFKSALLNRVVEVKEEEVFGDWKYVAPPYREKGFGIIISEHRDVWLKNNGYRMLSTLIPS